MKISKSQSTPRPMTRRSTNLPSSQFSEAEMRKDKDEFLPTKRKHRHSTFHGFSRRFPKIAAAAVGVVTTAAYALPATAAVVATMATGGAAGVGLAGLLAQPTAMTWMASLAPGYFAAKKAKKAFLTRAKAPGDASSNPRTGILPTLGKIFVNTGLKASGAIALSAGAVATGVALGTVGLGGALLSAGYVSLMYGIPALGSYLLGSSAANQAVQA